MKKSCALSFALLVSLSLSSSAQIRQQSIDLNSSSLLNQYLNVMQKSGLEGNDEYTIEAWVYPTSYQGFPTIVGNNYVNSFWFGLNESGRLRFYPTGSANGFVEAPSVVIGLNQWTHVAAAYNSATGWTLFANGIVVASGNSILGAPGTDLGDLRIGADREGGLPAYFWRGYLDEVRIWSQERSAIQIDFFRYIGCGTSNNNTGVYDGLQAWWSPESKFSGSGGVGDLFFLNGNPFNFASIVNGATFSNNAPPVAPNVGIQFNGIDDYAIFSLTLDFTAGLTIEAWVKPTGSFGGFPTIVGRDFTSSFWFGFNNVGQLRFYPTSSSGTFLDGSAILQAGRWYHVAAVYRDGSTRLYVNGKLDKLSSLITGPVGENGISPWIGADNNGGSGAFFYEGILDEVRITNGPLSTETIQRDMFVGKTRLDFPVMIPDEDMITRSQWMVGFDQLFNIVVNGTSAPIVRSEAPIARETLWGVDTNYDIHRWHYEILGGTGGPPLHASDITVNYDWTINDVNVFVVAPTTDLSLVTIRVRSPLGTWVELLNEFTGGGGRDIHTVYDDDSPNIYANTIYPWVDGVQPNEALTAFDGESTLGTWRLEVASVVGGIDLNISAWGISFNDMEVVAVEPGPGQGLHRLRLMGSHPVSEGTAFEIELASDAEVELSLYDLRGRKVGTIFEGHQTAGVYRVPWSPSGLSPGLYFARLRVDGADIARQKVVVAH